MKNDELIGAKNFLEYILQEDKELTIFWKKIIESAIISLDKDIDTIRQKIL